VTVEDLVRRLDLPPNTRVDQRVPKKLLVEHGAPTPADKKLINEAIEELQWLAALQPSNAGVPDYRDDVREYLEIEIIAMILRGAGSVARLIELVHRSIPYPVLLVTHSERTLNLSAAHKRWSQGETGKVVLEDRVICVDLTERADSVRKPFLESISIGKLQRTNMNVLYQGWLNALVALKASERTGSYVPARDAGHAEQQHQYLEKCTKLEHEIAVVRNAAKKEKQTARLVEYNLKLKQLQAALDEARGNL
jgi:hypothetical protein